jgi:ABC-2 type transport system ATP-binding protein
MITVFQLRAQYGAQVVLHDVTLDLPPGIHGIVGLNGSGKTTLLNTLAGFLHPTGGTVTAGGKPLTGRSVGFLETNPFFYPRITGREYLELFRLANRSFDVAGWNRLFDLPLDRLVDHYSTGMRKKLAFLGVVCLDRPVVILDEPYNGVDLESYRTMKQVIGMMNDGRRVILITSHVLESLTSLCDHIHHLHHGRIVLSAGRNAFPGLESRLFENEDQQTARLIEDLKQKMNHGDTEGTE